MLQEMSAAVSGGAEGLLGNSNGVMEDDLLLRGDTQPLNTTTVTEEDIHQFGNSCEPLFHQENYLNLRD